MPSDPIAATAALVDSLGAEALARAASYTAGGHWLLLWNLVATGLVSWLIVRSRWLQRVGATAGGQRPVRRSLLLGFVYLLLSWLLALPWSLYADWWRERSYARSSQPLADFLLQGGISALVSALVGAVFLAGLYALIRRAGRRWWAWSAALTATAMTALLLLGPVLFEPLFNDYTPLPEGEVRDALTKMAAQAGVPADRLFVYDGSRQSNNFTANVSGMGASARIAISDVALKDASLGEVMAVTGHEIGHWAEGHLWRLIAMFSTLGALAFLCVDRFYPRLARALGCDAPLADPAGLPVLMFTVSVFVLLATPVVNTVTRIDEAAADLYSLRTVNQPDALAGALLKSAEYRYPRPHPLQEFLFYSHPSVERRVLAAMRWKAGERD
jgi:STE24 endopeptidase